MLYRRFGSKYIRFVFIVVAIFTLLSSLGTTTASSYYNLILQSQTTISPPQVALQEGTVGASTIYANSTSAKVSVAAFSWLGGWDKRVKITVDSNDVDNALSTFPVLVHLSNSSGRNDDDVSFIFDELQSDANRKKIAVTTSDGTTQCYVEIEKWNNANQKAWLWVKVPSISNTTDTELYLYYDKDHADNSVYVGETGSTAAQNVWDTNFKGVWHLKDLTTSTVEDSTSNNNDGTKGAANQPIEVDAKIGKGQDFTPTVQYVEVGTTGFSASSGTVEACGKAEGFSGTEPNYLFGHTTQPPWTNRIELYTDDVNGNLDLGLGDSHTRHTNIQDLDPNIWYHVVLTWNGTNYVVYVDGVSKANGTYSGLTSIYSLADIGNDGEPTSRVESWNGTIDEVRVSDVPRGAAWVKASYESERDDLLDFGIEKIRNSWGADYNYRKQLTITNNIASTLGSGYTVLLMMDTASLVSSGKMLSNGNDLRIVNWNGSSFVEIYRDIVDMNTNSTQIWFKTQAGIGSSATDTNYYMYYGNPSAQNPPEDRSNVYLWFDDFSTNSTSNYDVDRHADVWHGANTSIYNPYWDSVNNAVYFDTGDNYAGDWMPNAINETDVYAEMKMNITGSYATNTTNGILLRWQNSSSFYGGHISGGSYLSPCIIKNGRTTYVANNTSSEYHVWNQWFTFAVAVYGSDLKLWVDGVQKVNGTDTEITTSGKVAFVVGQSIGWMDDFKIRKYVEPEPTLTSDGEERISYNYVLRVNNTVTDSWEIRLKKYSNSTIGRLQNCTIYFHNSTDGSSTQIYIENGLFNQTEGSWYNLTSLETIYIAMTVEANSIGTSHISTYLEVRKPGTTIYAQYIIEFEIT